VSVDQRGQPIDIDLGIGVSVIAGFDLASSSLLGKPGLAS